MVDRPGSPAQLRPHARSGRPALILCSVKVSGGRRFACGESWPIMHHRPPGKGVEPLCPKALTGPLDQVAINMVGLRSFCLWRGLFNEVVVANGATVFVASGATVFVAGHSTRMPATL